MRRGTYRRCMGLDMVGRIFSGAMRLLITCRRIGPTRRREGELECVRPAQVHADNTGAAMTKLRLAALLLVLSACQGAEYVVENCTSSRAPDADGRAVPLEFVACANQQPYSSGSVPIFVGIRNASASPQLVRTFLDVDNGLQVQVISPSGTEQQPQNWFPSPELDPDIIHYFQYFMPRGGVMGRTIDFVCDHMEYVEYEAGCTALYSFETPGTYRISLQNYAAYWCPEPCDLKQDSLPEVRVSFPKVELLIDVRSR
jgi:hypothetical protein